MNNKWLLTASFILLSAFFSEAQATPTFASQYKMKCNSCHTLAPVLNKTGLAFLRNGFRFSKNDKTLADAFLDANSSKERVSPIHGLIGINIDSKNEDLIEKLNLYFGGSLSQTFSLFAVTRSTYNMPKDNKLFDEANSRAYVQWNPVSNEHVVKVGWMDPYAMFSNLNRTLMDNTLMGSGLFKKSPKSALKPTWATKPTLPPPPSDDASAQAKAAYQEKVMPKQPYVLPIAYTQAGLMKGIEYSYLYNDKVMFLVNYGIPSSNTHATNDDREYTVGLQLKDIKSHDMGLIYFHQEVANIETDSYILPIEGSYLRDQLQFQQIFVYKESNQFKEPYYASQTTFIYLLDDAVQLRAILAFDRDEAKEHNNGYSVTYSRMWDDKYLIHLTGARHIGAHYDEGVIKLSAYFFF